MSADPSNEASEESGDAENELFEAEEPQRVQKPKNGANENSTPQKHKDELKPPDSLLVKRNRNEFADEEGSDE